MLQAWFKELIGYFRQHLPSDHVFKKSENIVSMVPRKILIGCVKALRKKTLELLFIHTLNDITTLSHKGYYGYCTIILLSLRRLSGANTIGVVLIVELLKLSHPSIVDECTEMVGVNYKCNIVVVIVMNFLWSIVCIPDSWFFKVLIFRNFCRW